MAFQSYHPSFEKISGTIPTIELLLEREIPFAHEAGVFIADTNELFITSNRLFDDRGEQWVEISRVKLGNDPGTTTCEKLSCAEVAMANGGVNYENGILLCAQGNQTYPSALYHISLVHPFTTKLLLSDFYGRPFNSLNDVVVHSDGSLWFTDPTYGYEQGYRPRPRLPSQVYRFDRQDGSIRAMADGFGHPNGICFSPDETIAYITDTDWIRGDGNTDDTRVSSIYAFDLTGGSRKQFLTNRRLFAMCDTGVPDGIKCDVAGNVYSGCGDGVNIWSDGGTLIGKILVPGGVANFCFGKQGEMFLLNETKLWRARLSKTVTGALLGV